MGRISVDGTQFLPLDMERSRFCLPSGSFPSVRFFSSSVNLREHVGLCVPRHGVGVARQLLLAPIPTVPYPSQRLRMFGTRTYLELRPFFPIHSVSKPVEIGQRQGLCHSVHVEAFLLSSLSPSHRLLSLHFRPFLSLLPPHDLVFFVLFSDEARACVRSVRHKCRALLGLSATVRIDGTKRRTTRTKWSRKDQRPTRLVRQRPYPPRVRLIDPRNGGTYLPHPAEDRGTVRMKSLGVVVSSACDADGNASVLVVRIRIAPPRLEGTRCGSVQSGLEGR